MRHKTFLINPEIIKQNGINIYKCIQQPGEFVITFGGSYHAGFNMGFNCAEAVNFATKNWIDIGIKAKICKCQKDSVQIGMTDFCKELYEKKIIKKKELENYLKAIEEEKLKFLKKEKVNETSQEKQDNDINLETKKVKREVKRTRINPKIRKNQKQIVGSKKIENRINDKNKKNMIKRSIFNKFT